MRIGLELSCAASIVTLLACSSAPSSPASSADAGANEGGSSTDAGGDRASVAAAADGYCERIVDSFCSFYMRCGRIVASSEAECRSVFLETCNARYEPRYVDLERAGLLALSSEGVAACEQHLAAVACEDQLLDLAGPCAGMWKGSSAAGQPCGLDVESFVCGSGTTCVLGLDLCGTCEAAAKRGEPCGADNGGLRCSAEDTCQDGKCVARPASSVVIVGEGEACDAGHRCAYRAFCEAGKCVKASLLGEPCATDRACASGRCEAGNCVALRAADEPCKTSAECASGLCQAGKCRSLPSVCFSR